MSNLLQQKQIEGKQLAHNWPSDDSFSEYIYSGSNVTNIIIWTDSGKTIKVHEWAFIYAVGKVSTETITHYDSLGIAITGQTLTGTYVFTGSKLTTIDWVKS